MIEITASKGLGDSIYLRAIVLHLLKTEEVTVFTRWPELFRDRPATVRRLAEINGSENMRYAAYCLGCMNPCVLPTDLFTRACLRAGITEPVELRVDWKPQNTALLKDIRRKAAGRKILVFQPNKIADNEEQASLRPDRVAFNNWLAGKADYFRVKIGSPDFVVRDESPCDLDLFGKTSVTDALDIVSIGDLFFGESCFVLVMAEAMDKPFVCMFSKRGLDSERARVRGVKPDLIFHKKHLATAVYD